MGKKSPKLQQPTVAAFASMPEEISRLLESESDRGAVLILGAYIEELLGLIIRAKCVSDADADQLLQLHSPAGDFDSRILLCKAFALIHPDEASALRAVQKIRNSAAHFDRKGRGFDTLFDSQATVDQVANLCKCLNLNPNLKSREPKVIRESFILSARILASRMWVRLCEVYKADTPKPASTFEDIASESRQNLKDTLLGKIILGIEEKSESDSLDCMIELNESAKDRLVYLIKELEYKILGYEKTQENK